MTLRLIPTEFTDIAAQRDSGSLSYSFMELTRKSETMQKEKQKPQSDLAISRETKQQSTDLNSIERLLERLKRGPKDRAKFVDSQVNKGIAYQIRALRDRQDLSQEDLAQLTGMNQNAISRLESPTRGRPTISTLKRLAEALDVALVVRFVPFSQFAKWHSGTPYVERGLSTESLAAPSFTEETNVGAFNLDTATHQWLWIKPRPGGLDELLLSASFTEATPILSGRKNSTPAIPPKPVRNSTEMERLNA